TNYSYDDFNRLTKIKYPEATAGAGRLEENFTYDSAGNLLAKTDQAGRVTTFCYDTSNRLTSTIDPALKTTTYEYRLCPKKGVMERFMRQTAFLPHKGFSRSVTEAMAGREDHWFGVSRSPDKVSQRSSLVRTHRAS
ncbi:MAG: hypothetical protein ACREA9_22585, partial [Pyrinomonadaceae bacterium]